MELWEAVSQVLVEQRCSQKAAAADESDEEQLGALHTTLLPARNKVQQGEQHHLCQHFLFLPNNLSNL